MVDDCDVTILQFKSMFFGMSQSTTAGSQTSQPPPVVLAEDSDED